MFLFENFTYDENWAAAHYGESFKHPNWYLESIINDYNFIKSLPKEDIKKFHFAVNKLILENSDIKNIFKITVFEHIYNQPDPEFTQEQIDYLTNKLSILGDAVKIIIPNINGMMVIQYFIEKDEIRWNKIQNQVKEKEDAISNITIPEPSFDSWIQMIEAFKYGKNPRIIFKKIKELNELLEKLVIAIKLKWPGAINAIKWELHKFLKSDIINKNNQLDNTWDAALIYASKYNIPDEIQEILNDSNEMFKSEGAIPVKGKFIADKLNNCNLVKKYSIKQYRKSSIYSIFLVIYIELINGNTAYIAISKPNLYVIRIYKDLEIKNDEPQPKNENKIGNAYFSIQNKNRSNRVLNDTFDTYFDQIINTIQNCN